MYLPNMYMLIQIGRYVVKKVKMLSFVPDIFGGGTAAFIATNINNQQQQQINV